MCSSDLVAGVWIGNDQGGKPMRTPQGNLGSGMAAALWGVYVDRVLAGKPVLDFPPPWAALPTVGKTKPQALPERKTSPTASPPPFSAEWWGVVRRRLAGLAGGRR